MLKIVVEPFNRSNNLFSHILYISLKNVFICVLSWVIVCEFVSFSARTLPELLNGVYFAKKIIESCLKNHINPFFKLKIVNTQLIMR